MLEIEAKYYLGDEARARDLCLKLGLTWKDGTYENNRIFDFEDDRLQSQGALVRVRERGASGWLTYKERTDQEVPHAKVRLEYDSEVDRPDHVIRLLRRLGLREVVSYERRRARHQLENAMVEIDALPGGWFCEIEAAPKRIGELILQAGLKAEHAIVWSYPEIFRRICQASNSPARAWTFAGVDHGEYRVPPANDPLWLEASREV